MTARQCKQY
uniref:Uncharacterized protein n=1 Tax=Anguilla anguilla TaxID=7936 RepID=A0A0E9XBZ0_ANGAN